MKKTILFLICIALLIAMTACLGPQEPEPTPDPKPPTPTVYEKLNGFAELSYRQIDISIVTVIGKVELSSNFALNSENVAYSIEKLNTFPTDGNFSGIPSSYKTTYTGSAEIKDGKVIKLDNNDVMLPDAYTLQGKFDFAKSNLENVVLKNGRLIGDVISPSALFGKEVDVEDVKIDVEYSDSAFERITIIYTTENVTVTTVYEFGV